MVPAAGALLWALLLSLGPRAAGAEGLTSTAMPRDSFRFGGPMTRSYRTTARTTPGVVLSPRMRVTMEDEDDVLAAADRLAGPAAAELLASTVATGSRSRLSQEEDGSLEEGVVIYARKNDTESETDSTTRITPGRPSPYFTANDQDSDIKMSSSLPHSSWKANVDSQPSDSTTNPWSSAGSTLNQWPPPSPTAMPAPEDLRLVLLPWGPWHCHCKSGTMSRTRAGRLHGLSGRLRVGALSQVRTEHRPCTYHLCPCNREREECPLDAGLCADTSCTTQTTTRATTRATTTTPFPPLTSRLRPAPFIPSPIPSPHPAYAFWKRVRIGLEDIWNNLSTMFTEMEPIKRNQR
ncbi:protein MENT isoform X1 [Bubalus bubalis]|uniref:protein MENT isoform X1 n=1 Tax=Bubalus bubalis TaxID=89462 RepID=UPI000DBC8C89|nr:protein MENT isoform X1 [Bubalus bubalis]